MMNDQDYWKECISVAAEECGLVLTDDQLAFLTESVQGGFENYSMAFGHEDIPSPADVRAKEELRQFREEKPSREEWLRTTKPCKRCAGSGGVLNAWGGNKMCPVCDGSGRVYLEQI